MAEKQSYAEQNKARLKDITDSIETGIKDLFQSDKYKRYLSTMSRFHRYSLNNTMLIYMQKPDTILCAGFNKWRDQFERNVTKGEKGIKIIAPTPYKKKIEEMKLDPDTKAPMLDADGNAIIEEKTIQIPMYKVVSVFDVAQTEGKPLPELAANLTGDVQNYEVFMEALKRSAPVPISFEAMQPDMDGYFSADAQRVAIREGMSEVQTVSATVHEIAHSKLHNRELERLTNETADTDKPLPQPKNRETEEIEAESISYAVCAYYGIQTGENSFGYLATWSKDKELSALRASLETINKTSSGLITDIDRNYAAIMKERGLDKVEQAAEQSALSPEQTQITEAFEAANLYYDADPNRLSFSGRGVDGAEYAFDSWKDAAEWIDSAPFQNAEINHAIKRVLHPEQFTEQETKAPTYPMPDPTLTALDMHSYGYTDVDMLPLTRERAIELYQRDLPVYMLYNDNTEAMALDTDEIITFDGMFGISRGDWELEREYLELTAGHELTDKELENSFLNNPADAFAIYQLKHTEDTRDLRFAPLETITAAGLTVAHDNYELVYTGELPKSGGTDSKLNDQFYQFNQNHPEDFRGHSLSVSDIVALKQAGDVSCHYVDSWGFKEQPAFLKPENYLKNAEMAMEDDYGMIDGIVNNGVKQPAVAELEQQAKSGTPISLMDLAEAVHRERGDDRKEKRPSVLAQLKSYQSKEKSNTAPKKSAEREL